MLEDHRSNDDGYCHCGNVVTYSGLCAQGGIVQFDLQAIHIDIG